MVTAFGSQQLEVNPSAGRKAILMAVALVLACMTGCQHAATKGNHETSPFASEYVGISKTSQGQFATTQLTSAPNMNVTQAWESNREIANTSDPLYLQQTPQVQFGSQDQSQLQQARLNTFGNTRATNPSQPLSQQGSTSSAQQPATNASFTKIRPTSYQQESNRRTDTSINDNLLFNETAQPRGESLAVESMPVGTSNRQIPSMPLPAPRIDSSPISIPLQNLPGSEQVQLKVKDELISLSVREAPLNSVLVVMSQQLGLSFATSSTVTDTITVTLQNVPVRDALDSVLAIANCTWSVRNNIIHITKLDDTTSNSQLSHPRTMRVFDLSFASAATIKPAVDSLLSPSGNAFIAETNPTNDRMTREQIIVEDYPHYVDRISQLIAELDRPPMQVLIQAHVLQVTLEDDQRHGVNFDYLQGLSGLAQTTIGFANPLANPATFFSIDGGNVDVLVEAIKETTDAKTLASPRVMVLNGQKARIQIGERLGFLVTTTTQTATVQDVQFLDVGVVLEVTPQIAADGRVLMKVKPKISGGQVDNGLPQEETTEVETAVMLQNGRGIVIGGLIQEIDSDRQSKLPIIGDWWWIGRLFQRRNASKERREIIVALVPYIAPDGCHLNGYEESNYDRATTNLLNGPLDPVCRPWEPSLPDAMEDPRRLRYDRLPHAVPNLLDSHPNPNEYYAPRASRNSVYAPTQYNGQSPSDFSSQINFGTADETYVPIEPIPHLEHPSRNINQERQTPLVMPPRN